MDHVTIVTRPHLTVLVVREGATDGVIRYDANNISLVTHEGRHHLSFVCSGSMTLVPVDQVHGIEFNVNGATWCMTCDGRLQSWPSNDPSYAKQIPIYR